MPERTSLFDAELHRQLRKIFLKTLGLRLAVGLLAFLAVAAWLFLAVVAWTGIAGEPRLWQALAVSAASLAVLAGLFLVTVAVPVLRTPPLKRIAFEVENRKDFQDIVAAAYEFSEGEDVSDRYSGELIREVIRRAVRSVGGLEVRFLFLSRRQLSSAPFAFAGLAILFILTLVSPQLVLEAGRRIVDPRSASAVDHRANLRASPGDVTVLSGSNVTVAAVDFGGSGTPAELRYNLSEDFWKTQKTEKREALLGGGPPVSEYFYTFENLRNSVNYYFQSGGEKSSTYRITVVHKPIVTDLDVVLTPPAYTGEGPDTVADSGGNVQALEGTEVHVSARANNPLRAAWVQFGEGRTLPVEPSGRSFEFGFTALRDGTYSILLEDSLGHKTHEPLVYAIEVYKDNPPVLDVLEPGDDASLPRNMQIEVGFVASDDYGVNEAALYYRKGGDESFLKKAVPLAADRGKRDLAKVFPWDLGDVVLFPGNYVEYYMEVKDNNVVTGPGVTKSRVFTINVPTIAELYDQVKEGEAKRADLFEEALKEAGEFKERMEKLSREFKKNPELDWSQKKEIDNAMGAQQDVQQKIEDIQKSLDETLESLSDNEMTSQQIGEKLEEIQRLVQELDDEALNKYIEELRQAVDKLSPEEIQKALENINISAEDLLRNLERTENLLREIQREQQMEEAVRKTQEILEDQEQLHDKTSDANEADGKTMKELSEEQKALAERAEELQKQMQELAEKVGEPEVSEQIEQANQQFSQSGAQSSMKKASEQLGENQKNAAMQSQEQAMEQLVALFNRMSAAQGAMMSASQRRLGVNLQRLAKSTLELSHRQEDLTNRLRQQVAADDVSGIRALAAEQQSYMKAVEQIANELHELSKKSLDIPEALLQRLGQTITSMQSALLFLEQDKSFMSTTSASQSIAALNQITIDLLSACRNCSGSSGGSGSQTALQQLLSGQQQVLQRTEELLAMQAVEEQLRQQQQAGIQRLLGEQRSLKELAEETKKESRDGERVLGRMDKIVEEMEEVIRDFEGGVLDQQTKRNEERILSRLLDAQRSVHSRDYEKKRESKTAADVYSRALDAARTANPSQMLREEIRRAMALKAPGEFEELIRLYFRALAEEEPSSNAAPSPDGGR